MRKIIINDTTLTNVDDSIGFKEKLDIIKKLDALKVDVIELPPVANEKADTLLVHTAAPSVKYATLACDSGYDTSSLEKAWNAVKNCRRPAIVVALPTSTVQMEYICHKKASAMASLAEELISAAVSYGAKVYFKAEDATRADRDFLVSVINKAVACGASSVILCDNTGDTLPDEAARFVYGIYSECGFDKTDVSLGVEFSDSMSSSAVNSFESARHGAAFVSVSFTGCNAADIKSFAEIVKKKGEVSGVACSVNYTTLGRTYDEVKSITDAERSKFSPIASASSTVTDDVTITPDFDLERIVSVATSLGYELSDEDAEKVYENAHRLSEKKPIGRRELEAVIATSAMQLPATYSIKSYVINSGNIINATAHVELEKAGEVISGISVGDGPIDAAFLSIEQIVGRHFELDDFQIRSVTEGREAVGEALVKLRFNGKLYSGRGVSTDIIGASIRAYVKALNKICYEEDV